VARLRVEDVDSERRLRFSSSALLRHPLACNGDWSKIPQAMLGQKSSKVTEIYTYVSERNIVVFRSPLKEIMAVGRAKRRELDRVELANTSSDILPADCQIKDKETKDKNET